MYVHNEVKATIFGNHQGELAAAEEVAGRLVRNAMRGNGKIEALHISVVVDRESRLTPTQSGGELPE